MSNPNFYTDKPEPKPEISRIGNGVETKMSNGTEIMVDVILCGGKSQAKKNVLILGECTYVPLK